jgi:hypothetical protein
MRFSRTKLRLGIAVAVATAAVAGVSGALTAPAHAGLGVACPDPLAQIFMPWGDWANYASVPNGGFENGSAQWTLAGGASVVGGNEPFFVGGSGDSSLSLPAGSSATSAPMCIGLGSSKVRFFIGGAAGSSVRVQVVYRGGLGGVLGILDGGKVTSTGEWAPSPEVTMLGGIAPLLTASVQFRFLSISGQSRLDDVYLDPWKVT